MPSRPPIVARQDCTESSGNQETAHLRALDELPYGGRFADASQQPATGRDPPFDLPEIARYIASMLLNR